MNRTIIVVLAALASSIAACSNGSETTAQPSAERGEYLVTQGLCNDCHTPGFFFGMPDMARFLGGSDVGFEVPGLGVFVGRNLTPDRETGIGDWTEEQIVAAIQTGKRPDGRELAPIMPWRAFANLTPSDAMSIAIYLKSLPAVSNRVPGPFGPNETPTTPVMKVVPPPGAPSPAAPAP